MFYTPVCSEHGTVINLPLRPYVGSSVDEILTCNRKHNCIRFICSLINWKPNQISYRNQTVIR